MMRCLERDRDKRFSNVAELALAIAPFGGPDAMRSASRAARTQGIVSEAPVSRPSAIVDAATVDPGPSSLHSKRESDTSLENAKDVPCGLIVPLGPASKYVSGGMLTLTVGPPDST